MKKRRLLLAFFGLFACYVMLCYAQADTLYLPGFTAYAVPAERGVVASEKAGATSCAPLFASILFNFYIAMPRNPAAGHRGKGAGSHSYGKISQVYRFLSHCMRQGNTTRYSTFFNIPEAPGAGGTGATCLLSRDPAFRSGPFCSGVIQRSLGEMHSQNG